MDDNEDVTRAQKGDAAAMQRVLRELYPLLYRMLARMLGDASAAEDVTQDACIKLVRHLPGFRGESAFRTWALSIAYNTARDYLRHARLRRHQSLDTVAEKPAENTGGEDSVFMRQIWAAVNDLDEPWRTTAFLIWGEGYTQNEAAAIMTCSVKTIEARVADIRKRLARQLKGGRHGR